MSNGNYICLYAENSRSDNMSAEYQLAQKIKKKTIVFREVIRRISFIKYTPLVFLEVTSKPLCRIQISLAL